MDRLSPVALMMHIVPQRVRWPKRGSGSAWGSAHDCVNAFENVVRDAEDACIAIEQNKDLSPDAIRRGRVEICEKALARLVDFSPLESAEKALSGRICALESLENRAQDQGKALQQYKQALGDLREGVEATKRTILEVCKMRVGAPV